MAFTPTALMLTELKMLLGIEAADTSQDELLNLILTQTGTKVLNDINQDTLPGMLEPILVEIASDSYRMNASGTAEAAGEIVGTVSSVSDNGQSVSYRDSSYTQILKNVSTAIKDYAAQLSRFRKPGW